MAFQLWSVVNLVLVLKRESFSVLIDLKKAFDTVDHKILLKKLWCFGLRGNAFNWFESYLKDHMQLTLINNTESDLLQEDDCLWCTTGFSTRPPVIFIVHLATQESGAHFIVCVPIRDRLEKMQIT